MDFQTFYAKGPHPLWWAVSRAAREKIKLCGIPTGLSFCIIFILFTFVSYKHGYEPPNETWRATCRKRMFSALGFYTKVVGGLSQIQNRIS